MEQIIKILQEQKYELIEGTLIDITNIDTEKELRECLDGSVSKFTKSLLNAMLEIEDGKKKIENIEVRKSGDWDLAIGWNESKQDSINTLKSIRELL